MRERRITTTVGNALVDAAAGAVADGRAESVSARLGRAVATRLVEGRRPTARATAIAARELEHGPIGDAQPGGQEVDRDAATRSRARRRRAG